MQFLVIVPAKVLNFIMMANDSLILISGDVVVMGGYSSHLQKTEVGILELGVADRCSSSQNSGQRLC